MTENRIGNVTITFGAMIPNKVWLLVLVCVSIVQNAGAAKKEMVNVSGNATIDPAVMRVLHQVMETLESIRNAKVRDLDRASQSLEEVTANAHHPTHITPSDLPQGAEKPVITKTYGYKVTVYATPVNESEDGGGFARKHVFDLQPAESHLRDGYVRHGQGQGSRAGAREKGYEGGHRDRARTKEHLQKDKYRKSEGAHNKGLDESAHSFDKYGHDRGAANEKGLRERTEIEYFEREQFKKDKLDKKKLAEEQQKSKKALQAHEGGYDSYYGVRKPAVYYVDGGGGYQRVGGKKLVSQNEKDGKAEDHLKKDSAEGLRERGFKITVEREVYLKDRHHDAGFGEHNRKSEKQAHDVGRHKDAEGARKVQGTKEDRERERYQSEYDNQKLQKTQGHDHNQRESYSQQARPAPPVHYHVLGPYDHLYSSSNDRYDAAKKNDTFAKSDLELVQQYPNFGRRNARGKNRFPEGPPVSKPIVYSEKDESGTFDPKPVNNGAPASLDNIETPSTRGQQDVFAFDVLTPKKNGPYSVQYRYNQDQPGNNIAQTYPVAKHTVHFRMTHPPRNRPLTWTSGNHYDQLLQGNTHFSKRLDKESP